MYTIPICKLCNPNFHINVGYKRAGITCTCFPDESLASMNLKSCMNKKVFSYIFFLFYLFCLYVTLGFVVTKRNCKFFKS